MREGVIRKAEEEEKNAKRLGLGGSGRHLDILPSVLVSGYGDGERMEAVV